MSESNVLLAETSDSQSHVVESPPAAARPSAPLADDPRGRLLWLSQSLRQGHDRRLFAEYLRLRRLTTP